jgi:hypothetical protein
MKIKSKKLKKCGKFGAASTAGCGAGAAMFESSSKILFLK